MKKIILVISLFYFLPIQAADLPKSIADKLLSKAWHGYYTTDNGAHGKQEISLNFTTSEQQELIGMITVYNIEVGNGIFNASEFLSFDFDQADNTMSLSYFDPKTRIDRNTYTLTVTRWEDHAMTGLLYLTLYTGERYHIGTFRVE